MDTMHARAQALTEKTVATRRDLHMHPETAFQEVRTAGVVDARLRELGLTPRTGVGGTGVVAVWDAGRPGPTVLARADMDALPVPDAKDVPYASTTPGHAHACGHDGHTAVLLSVAETVVGMGDALAGRVVFVFQPAEEVMPGGAEAMLQDGALEGLAIDHVTGLHLSSQYETGTVALRAGPAMAATDTYDLILRGRGGHAARPQETIDPIVAGAELVTTLQTLVSRELDPIDRAVISVTRFEAGSAYNVIPQEAHLAGTLRTFEADTRERLRERIHEVAASVAATHRADADVRWTSGFPAVVNDPTEADRLRAVAERVVGPERVVEMAPIMGGDDMAYWLQQAPGCYAFVGASGGDATAWPHHHPNFDVDEAALPIAVELLASSIVDALGGPTD